MKKKIQQQTDVFIIKREKLSTTQKEKVTNSYCETYKQEMKHVVLINPTPPILSALLPLQLPD